MDHPAPLNPVEAAALAYQLRMTYGYPERDDMLRAALYLDAFADGRAIEVTDELRANLDALRSWVNRNRNLSEPTP